MVIVMNDKRFTLSFEVGLIMDDSFNDKLVNLILESLKHDVKHAIDKNLSSCSNLICSKDIKVVELDSSNLGALGGD